MDVKLVASQTKVAPLQKQSIPRLELVCAMILVRLAKTVQKARLASKIGNRVLGRLNNCFMLDKEQTLEKYVISRVQEIQAHTTPDSWVFCSAADNQNPADIPSRATTASELVSKKRLWNGPEFLCKEERKLPQENNSQSDTENAWKEIIQNPATTTYAFIRSAL